jgi:hypothetical protein
VAQLIKMREEDLRESEEGRLRPGVLDGERTGRIVLEGGLFAACFLGRCVDRSCSCFLLLSRLNRASRALSVVVVLLTLLPFPRFSLLSFIAVFLQPTPPTPVAPVFSTRLRRTGTKSSSNMSRLEETELERERGL